MFRAEIAETLVPLLVGFGTMALSETFFLTEAGTGFLRFSHDFYFQPLPY